MLDTCPDGLAVCGWRRERYPGATIYNRWCDLEWTQPPLGDVGDDGFGGDVVIRADALRSVGGHDAGIIAAEDSELSARLVQSGGRVVRVDRTMTYHDANIRRFAQWWSRSVRCGHAYAEVSALHAETGVFRRNMRSLVLWGVLMPLALITALVVSPVAILLVLGLYGTQIVRIARSMNPDRFPLRQRLLWGVSCLISQVPKIQWLLKYERNQRSGTGQAIIEYK